MHGLFWASVSGVGLSTMLAFAVCSPLPTRSAPLRSSNAFPPAGRSQARACVADQGDKKEPEKKEPTFEATRDFILRNTSKFWEDSQGDYHTYTLVFVNNKRLRYIHKFTSKYVPGYLETIEVALNDLDPTLTGKGEPVYHHIALATTNGARKIAVEVIPAGSLDSTMHRKSQERQMLVPGSDRATTGDQDQWDARLTRAWAHLIKLAGGKPSQEEPF